MSGRVRLAAASRASLELKSMTDAPVRSRRPYLLRAMHEWITDSLQTPHLVVDAAIQGVEVPRQYVQGGKIILNVSQQRDQRFESRQRCRDVSRALWLGDPRRVRADRAVLGIYARETGQGMIFSEADAPPPPQPPAPAETPLAAASRSGAKPTLKVVK